MTKTYNKVITAYCLYAGDNKQSNLINLTWTKSSQAEDWKLCPEESLNLSEV